MFYAFQDGSRNEMGKRKAADVYPFLETYLEKKEQQIAEILQIVERYERKRMAEEQASQTMSPLRRMLSGRKPDHHLALEYIHYVKKPMEQVRRLRKEIDVAIAILEETKQQDWIDLPEELEKEIT